jgi:hypothetical protein
MLDITCEKVKAYGVFRITNKAIIIAFSYEGSKVLEKSNLTAVWGKWF